mgnify:CR=1 FL=1
MNEFLILSRLYVEKLGGYLMEKWKLLFVPLLSIALVACSADNEAKEEKEDSSQSVEVEKGLLNVEVTMPADLFEGQNIDDVIAEAKENGVKEVVQNEDGSLTYKMSKLAHKKMIEEIEAEMKASFEEMETSEDYASIEKIEFNKSFDKFTLTVNREAFENSFDGFALLGVAIQTYYYQLFNGVSEEDYKATVELKDAETSEVYETIVYPDALEQLSETEE